MLWKNILGKLVILYYGVNMFFLLIAIEFGNCLILKTAVPWNNRLPLFPHFNIIILSNHLLSSSLHRCVFFSFMKGEGRKQFLLFLKIVFPPLPRMYIDILIDILPCWKGPEGWYQAENEPTAYSSTTDKAHLILAESNVWPADEEQLFSLSAQFW